MAELINVQGRVAEASACIDAARPLMFRDLAEAQVTVERGESMSAEHLARCPRGGLVYQPQLGFDRRHVWPAFAGTGTERSVLILAFCLSMIFSDLPSLAEAGFAKAGNRFPPDQVRGQAFSGSCSRKNRT